MHKKSLKIFILLFISIQLTNCKKTNWNENYREKEKSPFGTYIIYNEIENIFNDDSNFKKGGYYIQKKIFEMELMYSRYAYTLWFA